MEAFWSKVDKAPGLGPQGTCWHWLGAKTPDAYGQLYFRGKTHRAHRLSWELTFGPLPRDTARGSHGTLVCHHCDNPICVRPEHLFLGNNAASVADRRAKGRSRGGKPNGEQNVNAKLTTEKVQALRAFAWEGVMNWRELGRLFGMTGDSLHRAYRKESWKHI